MKHEKGQSQGSPVVERWATEEEFRRTFSEGKSLREIQEERRAGSRMSHSADFRNVRITVLN